MTEKPWRGMNGLTVIGEPPASIGNWSWGCQVRLHRREFERVLAPAKIPGMKLFSHVLRLQWNVKFNFADSS